MLTEAEFEYAIRSEDERAWLESSDYKENKAILAQHTYIKSSDDLRFLQSTRFYSSIFGKIKIDEGVSELAETCLSGGHLNTYLSISIVADGRCAFQVDSKGTVRYFTTKYPRSSGLATLKTERSYEDGFRVVRFIDR